MKSDKYHPDATQLDELDAKISSARKEIAEGVKSSTKPELPQSLVGLAMRAGVELVAGVAVGAGVGYGLLVIFDVLFIYNLVLLNIFW